MTSFSGKPLARGKAISIRDLREHLPQWHVFARAKFELRPDYANRALIGGDNVRSGACTVDGNGHVDFERPLRSPILRAYTTPGCNPVLLMDVRRYGVEFKIIEWRFAGSRMEEFIFECRAPA